MEGNDKRQAELLLALEEAGLTPEEEQELVTLLAQGPEARRRLTEHFVLSTALRARLGGRPEQLKVPLAALSPGPARRFAPVRLATLGLAALTLLGAVSLLRDRWAHREATRVSRVLAVEAAHGMGSPMFDLDPTDHPDRSAGGRPLSQPTAQALPFAHDLTGALLDPYLTVQAVPAKLLARQRGWEPDGQGMYMMNQVKFECAGHQYHGMETLVVGVALGRAEWIEQGWHVLEATFAQQKPEGNFGDGPACVSWWIASVDWGLRVLEGSPFASAYKARVESLRPLFARAGRFLIQPVNLAKMEREVDHRAHTAIVAAAALAAVGRRLGDPRLLAEARALADLGISRQQADGGFEHFGGDDLGFHADRLMHLHWMLGNLTETRYQVAAVRAGEWLRRRLPRDGFLDPFGPARRVTCLTQRGGQCTYIPWREVRWALLFQGARFHDVAATDLADRMFDSEVRWGQGLGNRPS